jgi:hypothetical protein
MVQARSPSNRYYGEVQQVLSVLRQAEGELHRTIRDQEAAHIPDALEGRAMLREAIAVLFKVRRPLRKETKHGS